MPQLNVYAPGGRFVATPSADPDHPGISVDFVPNGETYEIPLTYTETNEGRVVSRMWSGAPDREDPVSVLTHAVDASCPDLIPPLPRRLVYVCSPYKGANMRNRQQNIQDARMYGLYVLKQGHIPYIAHLAVCGFLDDDIPAERQAGIEVDAEMMNLCDELWVFGDERSPGMTAEIAAFEKAGKPVKYVGCAGIDSKEHL